MKSKDGDGREKEKWTKLNIKYKYDFCCCCSMNWCAKIPIQIHEIHFSTQTHQQKTSRLDVTVAWCGYSIWPSHQSILLACTRFFLSSWLLAWYIAFLRATHIYNMRLYTVELLGFCIDGGFFLFWCSLACKFLCQEDSFVLFALLYAFDRAIMIGKMSFFVWSIFGTIASPNIGQKSFVFDSHFVTRDLAFLIWV